MPKKTGVCINIGGKCSKALNRELQTVEATNFVCEECGKDLKEKSKKTSTGPNIKLIAIIASVVILIAGVVIAVLNMQEDTIAPPPPPASAVFVNNTETAITITYEIDNVEYSANIPSKGEHKIEPIEGKAAQIYTQIKPEDKNFLVNGNNNYSATTLQDGEVYTITMEPEAVTPPVQEEIEPYTYEGATQNGKPHGNGTMTFNKKCVVPGSKGNIVAQPGEYAQGKWVNGEVNLVTLYQKDGNRVIITHK